MFINIIYFHLLILKIYINTHSIMDLFHISKLME